MDLGPNATPFEDDILKALDTNFKEITNTTVCGILEKVVVVSLGGSLNNLSMALEPWMAPISPVPPGPVPDIGEALDLERTPVITFLNYMAGTALGPGSLDDLIDLIVPAKWVGSDSMDGLNFSLPLGNLTNKTLPFGLGNLTATVGLSGFNVSGFDTFNGLTVFEAVGPQTLHSSIGLAAVTLQLTAFIELTAPEQKHRPPLVEWIDIFIEVDNVTLNQLTQVCA
jgi:hypothetical protein